MNITHLPDTEAPTLGQLESVDPRLAWGNEARGFTPWLSEHLDLLSRAIGIPLELEAVEKNVGAFRADILAKTGQTGQWVLIENQLEKTDHCHLGQLITYASGLKAVTVVWIASTFAEEHRSALDWLNEVTMEGVNFFGVTLELWRIGDSALAPRFNVVSKPNTWVKGVTIGASSTVSKQQRIRALLEDNPDTTVTQIVQATGVSKGYASQQRTRFLQEE